MRWPPPPPSRNGSRAGSWGRWRRALRFRACIRPMPRTRRATRRASPETPMKLDSNAKGVYVIAPTPFHTDGRIDDSSIDRMTDFFLKAGVTGMTVLGQLGEASKGVYVIAPTPFHTNGRIDDSSIDRMTDFFLKAGVTGMTVLGQLGEAPKLEHKESVDIVKRVVARA